MQYSMENYDNLRQFIRHIYIDRQYPLAFNFTDDTLNLGEDILSFDYLSTHDYSYHLTNLSNILFRLSERNYDVADHLYINVVVSEEVKAEDILVELSESRTGEPVDIVLKAESQTVQPYKLTKLHYLIKDTSTKLDKRDKDFAHLQSINIKFPKELEEIYISDLVFKTDDYGLTLEDIDHSIKNGEDHVLSKLGMNYIPEELEFIKFKAGGAYAWLKWWQTESKVMDDGDENSKNYYNRLLQEVDEVIASYLDQHPNENSQEINMDLVGFGYIHSQRPPCAKGARPRISKW